MQQTKSKAKNKQINLN